MDMPEIPFIDNVTEGLLMDNITEKVVDPEIFKATNEAFLNMLKAQYWHQLDAGEFVSGTSEADLLLRSVSLAFTQAGHHLGDWELVLGKLLKSHEEHQTDP